MADWANAIVEFKVLPKYKKSFETIFKRKERGNNRLDWYEYFDFITIDGELKRINAVDNEDTYWLKFDGNIGYNTNIADEFKKDMRQGICGDTVVLKFGKKWSDVARIRVALSSFLEDVAESISYCEIIAPDEDYGEYCRFICEVTAIQKNGFTFMEFATKEKSKINFE